jgi:chromosome condensin MukBEF MukE localization factor
MPNNKKKEFYCCSEGELGAIVAKQPYCRKATLINRGFWDRFYLRVQMLLTWHRLFVELLLIKSGVFTWHRLFVELLLIQSEIERLIKKWS